MAATGKQANPQRKALLRNLRWAGPLTVIAALLANLVVREIAVGQFGISPRQFSPIEAMPVVMWTVIGVGGGVLIFAYLVPRAAHPVRTFGLIAVGVLVVSFLPNLWLLLERPFVGTTGSAVFALMLMHVVAAVVCFGFLAFVAAWVRYLRPSSSGRSSKTGRPRRAGGRAEKTPVSPGPPS